MEWGRLVGRAVGLLLAIPVLLRWLLRLLRVGPRRVFSAVPRPAPPACLTDSKYGQHKVKNKSNLLVKILDSLSFYHYKRAQS